MSDFSHLHSHTQFSLLDGASNIKKLFKKASSDGHNGLAITDHGNMYGVFQFVAEAWNNTKASGRKDEDGKDIMEPVVKPIVGCEFYLVENRHKQQFTKGERDKRFHQLLLAKNKVGYKNLVKLCSLGFMEGMYSKYPRIDKELILQYREGLIATTCCLAAEVPNAILNKGEEEAEVLFRWWLDLFGEDYYVELQRHGIPDQDKVNEVLLRFAKKFNVPVIATNDTHYVDQEDYNAHDILLCINTGEKQSTPSNKDFSEEGGAQKGKRFAFFNDQFFFKTKNQMLDKFSDLPFALENTQMIVEKVESLKLKQDILLPNFVIPTNFIDQDDYLKHLAYEGAKRRYGELDSVITERLDFELFTIRTMGFAGYFLIVQDFINKGREIGVYIGPGRGSAAGSAVAYCIGITNIDPIKYNLLFERFLNPDRKSMPDIDTDFEDNGRQKVIDYVVQKYGENQVAHIVTYGTMAAKSSIKDVARVKDLPLVEANMLAKLVPDKPGVELQLLLYKPLDDDKDGPIKKYGLDSEAVEKLKILREIMIGDDLIGEVIREAVKLEGSIRNTGIHAAGIIIAPKDLTEIIPVAKAKDVNLLITQYEGSVIENAGVIKMDFLGLKTLTILKDTVELIKNNYGIDIILDDIPLTDEKTFNLYQKGETNGTFQFESPGMQKYLRDLKPDKFADLVAMNALYRPGPIEYIPNFIDRKFGREPIKYDLPEMEEYLSDTYGITVYQEQVMLLSQKIAGFTKGDADGLRKAMGKKDINTLNQLKSKFINQAKEKGHSEVVLEKIWKDWEAFAQYAFNKSHSVCYAMVAYQTAFLKANYPAEYMAGVLTNNFSNADKVSFFLSECRNMGIKVLGPDINESNMKFAVNKKGEIRFTLSALKGLGGSAAQAIIEERELNGPYKSIFDFVKRVNLRAVNKRSMETLAMSGAFDSLGDMHRAQYIEELRDGTNFIDRIIKFGNAFRSQKENSANSLFGSSFDDELVVEPEVPHVPIWDSLTMLSNEKLVIGIYLSGHPLDDYKYELKHFCNADIRDVNEENLETKMLIGCIVKEVSKRTTKEGRPFAILKVEDAFSEIELPFFGEDYVKFAAYFEVNALIRITGLYRPRFKGSSEYAFKVFEIDFLNTIMEKEGKFLEIALNSRVTNYNTVNQLLSISNRYKGKHEFRVKLDTDKDKAPIVLRSKSMKVGLNSSLIEELQKLDIIAYSIRQDEDKYRKLTHREENEMNNVDITDEEND